MPDCMLSIAHGKRGCALAISATGDAISASFVQIRGVNLKFSDVSGERTRVMIPFFYFQFKFKLLISFYSEQARVPCMFLQHDDLELELLADGQRQPLHLSCAECSVPLVP